METRRPLVFTMSTAFGVGSAQTLSQVDVSKYHRIAGYCRCDSGDATLVFLESGNSGFTSVNSTSVSVSQGVTKTFNFNPLIGKFGKITVTGIVSATPCEVYAYAVLT